MRLTLDTVHPLVKILSERRLTAKGERISTKSPDFPPLAAIHQRMESERLALLHGLLIVEVSASRRFFGKRLAALKLREHYRATVLTVKQLPPDGDTLQKQRFPAVQVSDDAGETMKLLPFPSIRPSLEQR